MQMIEAKMHHLETLDSFVHLYHCFDRIVSTKESRFKTLSPLLKENSKYGKIWLLSEKDQFIGYLAVCYSYSIEFGGRDVILDEFYVLESERGKGYGKLAIEYVKKDLADSGFVAISLEVNRENQTAQDYYSQCGFRMRKHFHLMSCHLKPIIRTQLTIQ